MCDDCGRLLFTHFNSGLRIAFSPSAHLFQLGSSRCTFPICRRYLGQPEKTAEVLDRNGWMATGDLAVMDESGYIRIVGRLKDMVNRGGEKIFPAEVEAVLLQHPAVAEAALFGVADALFGEELGAWIQLRSTHEGRVTEAELRDFLREKVAHFKVPRYVRWVTHVVCGMRVSLVRVCAYVLIFTCFSWMSGGACGVNFCLIFREFSSYASTDNDSFTIHTTF